MIRCDSKNWPPSKLIRKFHRRILELRQRLVRRIEITNGSSGYRFRCESVREFNRCLKMLPKNPHHRLDRKGVQVRRGFLRYRREHRNLQ
jgi:hypothetical protein